MSLLKKLVVLSICLGTSLYIEESCNVPSKSYVVGSLLGQLGNQMFEIAAASALAWDKGPNDWIKVEVKSLQEKKKQS